jgi:hypothetical protein
MRPSQSFASGLLLLPRSSPLSNIPHLPPVHHETSKHNSPNDTKIKLKLPKCLGFKFKPHQINDSSHSNQKTDHLISQRQSRQAAGRIGSNRTGRGERAERRRERAGEGEVGEGEGRDGRGTGAVGVGVEQDAKGIGARRSQQLLDSTCFTAVPNE